MATNESRRGYISLCGVCDMCMCMCLARGGVGGEGVVSG